MEGLIHWLEAHLLSCPYKAGLGMDCPGCGFQRSVIALLKGEFAESFLLYPALLPILAMLSLLVLHITFQFRHGAAALKVLFFFNAALILASWVWKLAQNTH